MSQSITKISKVENSVSNRVIVQDDSGMYFAIPQDFITDGKLNRTVDGITGMCDEDLAVVVERAEMAIAMEELEVKYPDLEFIDRYMIYTQSKEA